METFSSGRPVVAIVAGLILILLGLYFGPLVIIMGGILFTGGLFKLILQRRAIRDVGRLMSDQKIKVTITDESIELSSDDFHRTYRWEILSRYRVVQQFLCLYCGSLLVSALPADSFTPEQIAFIKTKIEK